MTKLGITRETVSKVMSAYTRIHHGKTTSVKRNSERKSALTERDSSSYIETD
jgi:hypothetical protein